MRGLVSFKGLMSRRGDGDIYARCTRLTLEDGLVLNIFNTRNPKALLLDGGADAFQTEDTTLKLVPIDD
ncbi:MAG: hypothetical protein NTX25_10585 [Proteobacteria bacterium]|nr:hypothetical protein [Pseudomonadota bacterium]